MNAKLIICCFIGMIALSMAAPDYCALPLKSGMCQAYIPRFFFNSASGKCESFIYSGCQSNGNNFETREECEALCAV